MEPKQFPEFPLNEGISFTKCVTPPQICNDPSMNNVTKKSRIGELDISYSDSNKPIQADFYYRSRAVCERGTGSGECDLHVVFKDKALSSLISNNPRLAPPPQASLNANQNQYQPEAHTRAEIADPRHTPEIMIKPGQHLPLNPSPILVGGGLILLVVAAFIFGHLFNELPAEHTLKRLGIGTSGPYRKSSAKRSDGLSVSQSNVSTVTSSQQRAVSSEEMSKELLPIVNKLDKLDDILSRLSQIETEVVALTQQIQRPSATNFASFTSPNINNLAAINSPAIPSPPMALSLDLIKEAILANDYSLISSYPHDFVSETPESRQGLEDVKRFAIEGDQSQASGRTQSEFIVIPLANEHYLIPNILPNAADPARTIKRHADKNNIYRNGQGSNFLNLASLAVVLRNGDRYELANTGQVA